MSFQLEICFDNIYVWTQFPIKCEEMNIVFQETEKSYVRISSSNNNGLLPPVAKFALTHVSAARRDPILFMPSDCNVIPASGRYWVTPYYNGCAFNSLADLRDRIPPAVLDAGFGPHYLEPPVRPSPAPSPVDSLVGDRWSTLGDWDAASTAGAPANTVAAVDAGAGTIGHAV